jgi:hypothetical protein
MEGLKLLSRSEMRMIRGGDPDDCNDGGSSNCYESCLTLYSCYYGECFQMFPDPSSDEQPQCIDEVHDLSTACLNRC